MKVAVLGAGVVGVVTAYRLASLGCAVTIIDRRHEVAAEASHANGGQLSYDFASPMASPSVLRHLADYLLGRDEAFRISLAFNPDYLEWGARFLLNCSPGLYRRNARMLSALAHRSQDAMDRLRAETGVEFDHRKAGKLALFDNSREYDVARRRLDRSQDPQRKQRAVSADECVKIEPALANWRGAPIAGGLYAPDDEVGDARLFARNLARLMQQKYDGKILLKRVVDRICCDGRHVRGVQCGEEVIEADAVVVCMGVGAPGLLKPLGIRAPIWPIYGYSITAPCCDGSPQTAITDLGRKMVYSRIGGNLRVAGFADIGRKPPSEEERINLLVANACAAMPLSAQYEKMSARWVGMRPSTPNSLPIVSSAPVKGLFLNIGHGMFGWTLAAACAEEIAQMAGVQ